MKLLPSLNLTLSWRRALGLTKARTRFARRTGTPTTTSGLDRKVGCLLRRLVGL